jgi:hypothetical protein
MFTLRTLFFVIAGVALFLGGWALAESYYRTQLRGAARQTVNAIAKQTDLECEIARQKGQIEELMTLLERCREPLRTAKGKSDL